MKITIRSKNTLNIGYLILLNPNSQFRDKYIMLIKI